ncbi:DUF4238 domain-containing protein [Mycolicibacterium sp. 050158]|uniref:DUF4238 domain-containing protein n=1 Tax=Mycolicibacterium sp. 050158 TaxID=3090602 RepID=UPI00299CE4E7|nr:DUF4238 domain-containing protein [Mycolicibacterium sp. 050158]MDX1890426.1 DUF4238 domain-containing protein [Mycolicibacterium sp. 050158]
MDRLLAQQRVPDTESRRHHYVPQTYLRKWSFDGRRVWALDTMTGLVKPLGTRDVCVNENFYRVIGPDGAPHNRVEKLFGVVDTEVGRVQRLFAYLDDPEALSFDDLPGLGITMAVQRMRTLQQRRIQTQYSVWMAAQSPEFRSIADDDQNPHQAAGIHTESLFKAMWGAADVLITRQIEVWDDPKARFMTCDAPVLVPFVRNERPGIAEAAYIVWPVSPHRVVALSRNNVGEKAVIREATGELVGVVRDAVQQGRERMIFASEAQRDRLPAGKMFRRRTQGRFRCSDRSPHGEYIAPPGCVVKMSEAFADKPDVALCAQGLHSSAPELFSLA